MSRRERRDRIASAFEALRSSIAAALGAAANAREAVEREHVQATFERRLRTAGPEGVRADPELAAMVRRPDFAEQMQQPGVARQPVAERFDRLRSEGVQHRQPEQHGGDNLEIGLLHGSCR